MSHDLDPRWEWIEIATFGGPTYWVKRIASLCLTCDQQLPAEWDAATA